MPGLVDAANAIAGAITSIGAAAKMAATQVTEARVEVSRFAEEKAAVEQTTSGITKAGEGATDTKKLGASIQALAGRVR